MSRDDFDPPEVDPNDEHESLRQWFDQRRFLRALTPDDWDLLYESLWDYAEGEIRRHQWNGAAPTPRDLASRAILKVLGRPTMWDPSKRRRPLPPKDCLRKFLYDLIKQDARRHWEWFSGSMHVDPDFGNGHSLLDEIEEKGASPEEHCEANRMARLICRIERFCQARGYGDLFRQYFYLSMKPAQIAELIGSTAKRVSSRVQQMKELIRRHFGSEGHDFLRPA